MNRSNIANHFVRHAREFCVFSKLFLPGAVVMFAAVGIAVIGIGYSFASEDTTDRQTQTEQGSRVDLIIPEGTPLFDTQVPPRAESSGNPMMNGSGPDAGSAHNNQVLRGAPEQDRSSHQPSTGSEGRERMEKGQQMMEEQQKEQAAHQLRQIKSGLKQMQSMLKRVTTRIAQMKRAGITIPSGIQSNLDSAQAEALIILNAQSMDDPAVQDAMSDLQSRSEDLREAMGTLQQLSQISQMFKQADAQMKRLDAMFVSTQKMAQRGKTDLSAVMSQFQQAVSDIKSSLQQAKDQAANGDVEGAMQTLQDEVFEKFQDVYQFQNVVRTIQNVRANLGRFDALLVRGKRALVREQKAGRDATDLSSALDTFSADLNELKTLIAQPNPDIHDITDTVSALLDGQTQIQDELGGSTNAFQATPIQNVKDFQSFQNFSLPFSMPASGHGDGLGEGQGF